MRWAAARVDISPLALPSPEHELTDPMRGVTATIPGSRPLDFSSEHPMTPGGTRKTRLASFWQGTQDIDHNSFGSTQLTTIAGSPTDSHDAPPMQDISASPEILQGPSDPLTHLAFFAAPPPASAPALNGRTNGETISGDYFGTIPLPEIPPSSSTTNSKSSVLATVRSTTPLCNLTPMSVPALPRRVCLTRQTSSPLPASLPQGAMFSGVRMSGESITSIKAGRAAKEEQMFAELGYLAPPNPPDELERRRALYKWVRLKIHTRESYHIVSPPDSIYGIPAPISTLTE